MNKAHDEPLVDEPGTKIVVACTLELAPYSFDVFDAGALAVSQLRVIGKIALNRVFAIAETIQIVNQIVVFSMVRLPGQGAQIA